jgi:hypothetical protein
MGNTTGRFGLVLALANITVGILATGCCSGLLSDNNGENQEQSSCSSCGGPDYCGAEGGSAGAGMAGGGAGNGGQAVGGGGHVNGGSGGGGSAGAPLVPACNALRIEAPTIDWTYDEAAAPEPKGGKLSDGKYFLTAEIVYETPQFPASSFGSLQVEIAGDVWQEASSDDINPERRTTSKMTTLGASLALSRTCPEAGKQESVGYTVTDTGFTLYVNDHGKYFGSVFTKQ